MFKLFFILISVVILVFLLKNKVKTTDVVPEVPEVIEDLPVVPENIPKIPESLPEPVLEPVPEPVIEPIIEPIIEPVSVSKIVISKKSTKNKYLSLAEVQLFNGDVKASINGTASQSSTLENLDASKAIDGGKKFDINNKSVSVTSSGKNNWWRVILKTNVDATHIKIINTLDLLTHLQGAVLKVYDENNAIILEQTLTREKIQTYDLF